MRDICPCCKRPIARTRSIAAVPPSAPIDVDALSDEALREYRKRTAPGLDVDHMLCARMSAELRARFIALRFDASPDGSLKRGVNRGEFYRQYVELQGYWRRESNVRERAERIAAAWLAYGAELATSRASGYLAAWLSHGEALASARGVDDGAINVAA